MVSASMCVYISDGTWPQRAAAVFRVLLGVGKRRDPFSQLPGRGPDCLGAPRTPSKLTPFLPRPPPPTPSIPFRLRHAGFQKQDPPLSWSFINTSHHSSPSLHRDSKEVSTWLVRPEAPQPFRPHKSKFRLNNPPVLIFVLKQCVYTF